MFLKISFQTVIHPHTITSHFGIRLFPVWNWLELVKLVQLKSNRGWFCGTHIWKLLLFSERLLTVHLWLMNWSVMWSLLHFLLINKLDLTWNREGRLSFCLLCWTFQIINSHFNKVSNFIITYTLQFFLNVFTEITDKFVIKGTRTWHLF